ncbi:hypothetical protein EJF36_06945 [Bacillus sp. HMF5848]|uniref:hypothetical protein n=1 Tax=Bacillus sp. HMF5848 TaxID=2495421 RepID=UPI000F76F021|nr:hypothetical protein [Bacillus sp. HMF5848]RSK26615.1 hypothetical protein EJF36_06945 [Bacillus sp. HMF5848]
MFKNLWALLSYFIATNVIMIAIIDVVFLGSAQLFDTFSILAVFPFSGLGVLTGFLAARQKQTHPSYTALLINIILLLSAPAYLVYGALFFRV